MRLSYEFAVAFGVWEEMRPHAHLVADEAEMQLVVAMPGRAVTAETVAVLLGVEPGAAADLLQRAYRRHILNRTVEDGIVTYAPGSFGERLDHLAKFERWDEIPAADRQAIDRRFLDEFIDRHRASVAQKMQGLEAENSLPNDTILLLHEVEEMIDAATYIAVQPCDCRRLGQNCERPVETCVWLDGGALAVLERGYGRRLAHEEAKELVRWADRKGLMHTGDSEWQARGLHAICNCCACDCYPFRAARELGSKGVWPRSRYVAVRDRERCTLCGACVQRCHFEGVYHDGSLVAMDTGLKKNIVLDPVRCWGCGLCANTCPPGAIQMQPL
jgi:NAD-dependent dihydropyrimidine dehydrogenase PreA subunit